MNVGRMSLISFAVFLLGIVGLLAVVTSGSAVVLVPFIVVWLGSFAYAMYLWVAVMRYGDRRLVKRGTQRTAQVLSAKETSWAMSAGEYEGIGAPTVWKYGLQVSVAGKDPYPATLYICAHLRSGDTVPVYVSPHNAKRVTVDLKQLAAARDAELHRSALITTAHAASWSPSPSHDRHQRRASTSPTNSRNWLTSKTAAC